MANRNIDFFNEIAGLVFAQLYEAFPIPIEIDRVSIAEQMAVEMGAPIRGDSPVRRVQSFGQLPNGVPFYQMSNATLIWLRDEGFIKARGEWCDRDVCLTSKALAILNATPDFMQQSLGSKITEAVKETGAEARREGISKVVGEILGAAAKSLMN